MWRLLPLNVSIHRKKDFVGLVNKKASFRLTWSRNLVILCAVRGYPSFGADLAQLDRASGYEPEGRGFDSLSPYHLATVHNQQVRHKRSRHLGGFFCVLTKPDFICGLRQRWLKLGRLGSVAHQGSLGSYFGKWGISSWRQAGSSKWRFQWKAHCSRAPDSRCLQMALAGNPLAKFLG